MKYSNETWRACALCMLAALAMTTGCQNKPTETADSTNAATDSVVAESPLDNAVVRAIMDRRSVRKYKPEPVPKEMLDVILHCGINAPNAMNEQRWEVRVTNSKAFIDGVTKVFIESAKNDERVQKMVENPDFHNMFRNAPTVIFVAGKADEKSSPIDCGLLGENIMLAAQSMGLGTCCLGSAAGFLNSNPGAANYLKQLAFSDGYELLYAIAIGYPDESPEAKPRDASKVRYIE